jgi:hypothetical protein
MLHLLQDLHRFDLLLIYNVHRVHDRSLGLELMQLLLVLVLVTDQVYRGDCYGSSVVRVVGPAANGIDGIQLSQTLHPLQRFLGDSIRPSIRGVLDTKIRR